MKILTLFKGKEITITLTDKQLKEIREQTIDKYTIEMIDNISNAEKVLESLKSHKKCNKSDFTRVKDWILYQLETIIKASNYIDNDYKEWLPNFKDISTYKYLPHFNRKTIGWSLYDVYIFSSYSYCPVALYYKNEKTSKLIVNKFILLYNEYLG